jgi:hypothetical protein
MSLSDHAFLDFGNSKGLAAIVWKQSVMFPVEDWACHYYLLLTDRACDGNCNVSAHPWQPCSAACCHCHD